ncbi:MAG: hypothetical protein KIT31_01015 [Deltaproteobacteria bacterium]|nr:hypothetical protein [Deltaproteobacteria bacterium]
MPSRPRARLAKAARIVVHGERERAAPPGVRVAMVMPDYMSAALAVSRCDHVTVLPHRFAQSISRLLPLQLVGPTLGSAPIALYWHERTHGDAGAAMFRDLVVDAVAGRD